MSRRKSLRIQNISENTRFSDSIIGGICESQSENAAILVHETPKYGSSKNKSTNLASKTLSVLETPDFLMPAVDDTASVISRKIKTRKSVLVTSDGVQCSNLFDSSDSDGDNLEPCNFIRQLTVQSVMQEFDQESSSSCENLTERKNKRKSFGTLKSNRKSNECFDIKGKRGYLSLVKSTMSSIPEKGECETSKNGSFKSNRKRYLSQRNSSNNIIESMDERNSSHNLFSSPLMKFPVKSTHSLQSTNEKSYVSFTNGIGSPLPNDVPSEDSSDRFHQRDVCSVTAPTSLTALLGSPSKHYIEHCSHHSIPDTQPVKSIILAGVIAFVDVRSGDGSNRSGLISDKITALGGEVRSKLTKDVTHVIFRGGLKSTFQQSKKRGVHLVSAMWVEQCQVMGYKVQESLYPSVSIDKYSDPIFLSRLKKMKSMQPKDFEEVEQAVEERLKRKMKLASNKGASPCLSPATTTSQKIVTYNYSSPIDRGPNSPVVFIENLLTPNRIDSRNDIKRRLLYRAKETFRLETMDGKGKEVGEGESAGVSGDATEISSASNDETEIKNLNIEKQKISNPIGTPQRRASRSSTDSLFSEEEFSTPLATRMFNKYMMRRSLGCSPDLRKNGYLSVDKSKKTNCDAVNKNTETETNSSINEDTINVRNSPQRSPNVSSSSQSSLDSDVFVNGKEDGDTTATRDTQLLSPANIKRKKRKLLHNESAETVTEELLMPSTPLDVPPPTLYDNLVTRTRGVKASTVAATIDQIVRKNINSVEDKKQRKSVSFKSISKGGTAKKFPNSPIIELNEGASTSKNDSYEDFVVRKSVKTNRRSSIKTVTNLTPKVLKKSPKLKSTNSQSACKGVKKLPKHSILVSENTSSIVLTSFHSTENEVLYPVIKSLGVYNISTRVSEDTSHLVTGDANRRTVNLMLACLRGVPIVTDQWVFKSMEAGQWLPHSPFEVQCCPCIEAVAAIKRRGERVSLFSPVSPLYLHPNTAPPITDLKELLSLGGATLTTQMTEAKTIVWPQTVSPSVRLKRMVAVSQATPTNGNSDAPFNNNIPKLNNSVLAKIIASTTMWPDEETDRAVTATEGVVRSDSSMSVDYASSTRRNSTAGACGWPQGEVTVVHEKWLIDSIQNYSIQPPNLYQVLPCPCPAEDDKMAPSKIHRRRSVRVSAKKS